MRPSAIPISSEDLPSAKGDFRFLSTLFAQSGVEFQQQTKDTPTPGAAAFAFLHRERFER